MTSESQHYAADVASARSASGWLKVSRLLLLAAGLVNVVYGAGALAGAGVLPSNGPSWGTVGFWAVTWLVLGFAQIAAAIAVRQCSTVWRSASAGLAALLMVVWFVSFPYLPLLSLVLFVTYGFVLYALLSC